MNFSWNEWVTLPHLFSELPRTAMLAITILDCAGAGQVTVIGGTTISLFGKNGVFRQVNIIQIVLSNKSLNKPLNFSIQFSKRLG